MKIKKVLGINFKSHEELELNLEDKKTQLIVGHNGDGKSSALEMVRYAITGDAPENPINDNYSFMYVETTLEDGTVFRRQKEIGKTSKVTVNNKTASGKMLSTVLEDASNVPADVMKIVSSEEAVESIKSNDLSDLLMKYALEELNIDQLIGYADGISPEAEAKLRKMFPEKPNTFPVDYIKKVYDSVFDERKSLKGMIADCKSNIKSFEGTEPTRTMEEIDKAIEDIVQKESSIKMAKSAEKVYKSALAASENHEKEISDLKKKIAEITIKKPDSRLKEELQKRESSLIDEISKKKSLQMTLEKNLEINRGILDDLKSDVCPICSDIRCTTDRSKYKTSIEEACVSTEEGIALVKEQIEHLNNELIKVKQEISDYSNSVVEYNRKVDLISQLDSMEKRKIAVPEKPKEVWSEELEAEYEKEKNDLKNERKNIFEYEQSKEFEEKLETYQNEFKVCEEVVKLLSSKGIVMDNIVKYYLSYIEEICNEFADELRLNFKIKLVAEDGVKIYCYNSKLKSPIPYNDLSTGEKTYALFLVIHMLNELSGLKILLMDNLEKLDEESFASFLKLIMRKEIQDKYDHILLAGVNHSGIINEAKKYSDIKIVEL